MRFGIKKTLLMHYLSLPKQHPQTWSTDDGGEVNVCGFHIFAEVSNKWLWDNVEHPTGGRAQASSSKLRNRLTDFFGGSKPAKFKKKY